MNIEKTLPKIEKKVLGDSKYDKLYMELAELDRDIMELVKLIALRGDGHHIPQSLFDNYSEIIKNLDNLGALNIKKSKHEDLVDFFADMEDIYFELEEIDDKFVPEPTIIIEEPDIVTNNKEEVIKIEEKTVKVN